MIGTAWKGGDCPLPVGTMVEVKLRNGAREVVRAGSVIWTHYGTSGDVVEYRIVLTDDGPRPNFPGLIAAIERSQPVTLTPTSDGAVAAPKHSHYHKDVRHLASIDVYRICTLFDVTDPCLQHAIKKLLVAGGRGAGKDVSRDVQEAIDSLTRWQAMRAEDAKAVQS